MSVVGKNQDHLSTCSPVFVGPALLFLLSGSPTCLDFACPLHCSQKMQEGLNGIVIFQLSNPTAGPVEGSRWVNVRCSREQDALFLATEAR